MAQILRKRVLRGLDELYDLRLVAKDMPLLTTLGPGYQPSADFLAFNSETGTLFLGEVKRSPKTERELVTELSAYTSGLATRIWGLGTDDVVWLPICMDWRTTVLAATMYQSIWKHTACVPLRIVCPRGGSPAFYLEILDTSVTVEEEVAAALFSWASFDGLTVYFANEPADPKVFVDFVVATAGRLGLSGFVLYTSSNLGRYFRYPFGLTIGAFNPFKGALKAAQLRRVREYEGRGAMRRAVKEDLWDWFDLDLRTGKPFETLPERGRIPKGAVSLQLLASGSTAGVAALWNDLKPRVEGLTGTGYELGGPSILRLLVGTEFHWQNAIDHIAYFGMMQEAVYERLLWEFANAKEGDGPILGDVGSDPLRIYGSMDFWASFMDLMNWRHESQTSYAGNSDDGAPPT